MSTYGPSPLIVGDMSVPGVSPARQVSRLKSRSRGIHMEVGVLSLRLTLASLQHLVVKMIAYCVCHATCLARSQVIDWRHRLAVLIDRGQRELPIRADYVGKKVEAPKGQRINVYLREMDDREEVVLE